MTRPKREMAGTIGLVGFGRMVTGIHFDTLVSIDFVSRLI
jgi:hypothetical protein